MAIRNIARGGGKAFKAEVTGLKDLERKLKTLAGRDPILAKAMWSIVGRAGDELRDEMAASARAAGWASARLKWKSRGKSGIITGEDAIASIFSAGPKSMTQRQKFTVLTGVSKRKTMFEWIAGKYPRSPRARPVPAGNPVAMSLATALEFGTTRMAAKPAIRTAILNGKAGIIAKLKEGYTALAEGIAKS